MILRADARHIPLADKSVHCVVTSPPYWNLRDYHLNGQLGLEKTPEEYVCKMIEIFREVRRVLRDDGSLWINLGDSYSSGCRKTRDPGQSKIHPAFRADTPSGLKPKDLVGIPWRVAFALQEDGWYWRSCIPWIKRNCMPESAKDRPITAVEYLFLLTKSERYFYDAEVVKIPAALDTHARYARGRSESHKYADGEPGNQTIARTFAHMAGKDVLLPASYHGSIPGRKDGPGQDRRSGNDRTPGVNPKARTRDENGDHYRSKQNEGFAAVKDVVGYRNRRNSDWFMESWQGLLTGEDGDPLALVVNTAGFPGLHFATFPPRLVEPCILAGTSERGCCPKCRAPWMRVVEPQGKYADALKKETWKTGGLEKGNAKPAGYDRLSKGIRTIGWKRSCSCGLDPVPCTVLDPFAGSGTVGVVAAKHRRRAVLLDLKPEYVRMARRRNGTPIQQVML